MKEVQIWYKHVFYYVGKGMEWPNIERTEFARNNGSLSPLMSILILRRRGLWFALGIKVLKWLKSF